MTCGFKSADLTAVRAAPDLRGRRKAARPSAGGGHWGVGTKDLAAKGRDWGASDSWSSARDRMVHVESRNGRRWRFKAPYALEDNGASLLDHTDLVFINPVGTGYSAAIAPAENGEFLGS